MDATRATDLHALLKRSAVFAHLKRRELNSLLREMAWFWVAGGAPVYLRGETSDALYFLKSGSLGAFEIPRAGGPARMLGLIPAGTTFGEIGLISGDTRSHSVRALRDSELLRLPREGFERLISRHPQAMLGAARLAVQRLLHDSVDEETSPPRTFAVLPFDRGVDAHAFAELLQRHLEDWGECTLIDAELGYGRDTGWFTEREADSRFVLYVDDGDVTWQRLCQRQADALLLLVGADRPPEDWPYPVGPRTGPDAAAWSASRATMLKYTHHRPRHLVLHHLHGKIVQGAAHAWRHQLSPGELQHHHWRRDDDIARLARLLSGHSTGLVLSGGGARGFAQIGVIQALREAGIPVDAIVGTSVGAIIGAGIAYEWDDAMMRANFRRTMVEGKPLSDWTLPLVALTRGARTTALLRDAVGEIHIEDLPIQFACVSTDLTPGTTAVHREGLLWRWLRASSAVPGILPPLFHGGHVYVDGGVINNLPTDIMAEEHHGRMIAVDISGDDSVRAEVDEPSLPRLRTLWSERRTHHRRPSAFAILVRAAMVNSEAGNTHRRELADLLVRPDMGQIGMFDWHEFDRAIEIGYRCTRDALRGETPPALQGPQ
jgi:NTE family protein